MKTRSVDLNLLQIEFDLYFARLVSFREFYKNLRRWAILQDGFRKPSFINPGYKSEFVLSTKMFRGESRRIYECSVWRLCFLVILST